jgi:hypothetical protein
MSTTESDAALKTLSAGELRQCCSQRTSDGAHERFCFELFQRAIVERDQRCWEEIVAQYTRLVYRWLLADMPSQLIGDVPIDELVFRAFAKFWQFYQPEKLAQARGLPSVLDYLKTCTKTCVLEEKRRQKDRRGIEFVTLETIPESQTPDVADTVVAQDFHQQLWTAIEGVCHNQTEIILMRESVQQGLTPSAICARHPTHFSTVDEVYQIKRNLLNRLKRNEAMRVLWNESNKRSL